MWISFIHIVVMPAMAGIQQTLRAMVTGLPEPVPGLDPGVKPGNDERKGREMARGTPQESNDPQAPAGATPPLNPLDRYFGLSAAGTSVATELRTGLATFLTMACIMFVNPAILEKVGMDHGAVFVATCLAAAMSTAIMGLYANYPIALAPGMGLNAYFAFTMVPELQGNWQLALGCVFLSGVLFLAISLTPLREWLINAIPKQILGKMV
jgi:hypothetical protein